jgi:putative transcriptional regulator
MHNRLRELRIERRLTQAALGALVGASRQTINLIENAHHDPSLALAFAISRLFALPIETIFFDTPARPT